jgi:hypothetical protein
MLTVKVKSTILSLMALSSERKRGPESELHSTIRYHGTVASAPSQVPRPKLGPFAVVLRIQERKLLASVRKSELVCLALISMNTAMIPTTSESLQVTFGPFFWPIIKTRAILMDTKDFAERIL